MADKEKDKTDNNRWIQQMNDEDCWQEESGRNGRSEYEPSDRRDQRQRLNRRGYREVTRMSERWSLDCGGHDQWLTGAEGT